VVSSPPYNHEPTLAQLVGDLGRDAKELLRHELALAKYEISAEFHKTKVALVSVGGGIGIVSVGGLLLIVMFVHLLHTRTGLPLWTCYGMVGSLLATEEGHVMNAATFADQWTHVRGQLGTW
jgi:Putative Actinobacterial Holin-X, holin superfamily III